MKNINKLTVMFIAMALIVFLPKVSFAWGDGNGRDEGRSHHEHGFHSHANPDLTLVTGMDTIDRRVLIAGGSDPELEVIDQPQTGVVVNTPVPVIGQDMDTFIVNVPNNTGGYTPVLIKKWGNAYLGPQGELYYPFPQVSQLKVMYGI